VFNNNGTGVSIFSNNLYKIIGLKAKKIFDTLFQQKAGKTMPHRSRTVCRSSIHFSKGRREYRSPDRSSL
jgi:hypothetical protein